MAHSNDVIYRNGVEFFCYTTGGFNFDAKARRQSIDAANLFHGHIGGIDAIAHALV